MKAILINIFFLLVWCVLGHYFPSIILIGTFVAFPTLFLFSLIVIRYNISSLIIIPFSYLLILLNDYLFRVFGGGIHDDAGKGWCELIFYLTLITTTLTMLIVGYKLAKENKSNWLYNSILVFIIAFITYFIFIKYNVKI